MITTIGRIRTHENNFSLNYRLDFVSFTTAQPTAGTCTADTFTVGGASTVAPTICGDNAGQHSKQKNKQKKISEYYIQLENVEFNYIKIENLDYFFVKNHFSVP